MERRIEASGCPGVQRNVGGYLVPPVHREDPAIPLAVVHFSEPVRPSQPSYLQKDGEPR